MRKFLCVFRNVDAAPGLVIGLVVLKLSTLRQLSSACILQLKKLLALMSPYLPRRITK